MGVDGFIFTTGKLDDCQQALDLCDLTQNAYTTIGIHPSMSRDPYYRGKASKEAIEKYDERKAMLHRYFSDLD